MLRNLRAQILKNLFASNKNLKIIIGSGDRDAKRNFFLTQGFEIENNALTEENIGGIVIWHGVLNFDGRRVCLFLLPFFDNRHIPNLDALSMICTRIRIVTRKLKN
jgi:hypothetical protein